MSHVFISYAREDYARARAIAEALRRNKVPVWWDEKLQLGERFVDAIRDALGEASAVVALWSRSSVRSDWVCAEAAAGAQNGVLVPVLLDDVRPPGPFADLDAADLKGWDPRRPDREFDDLLAVLHALAGTGAPRGGWSVERLDTGKLMVSLDRERHTVEYDRGRAYVDGHLVPVQANPLDYARCFQFDLTDGGETYFCEFEVTVSAFAGRVKNLALSVGGRPLYDG